MKRVIILGAEGFIGTALDMRLSQDGYETFGIDNGSRQMNVMLVGGQSITLKEDRHSLYCDISTQEGYERLKTVFTDFKPDAIIHLAEQPSAPFSMMDALKARETQMNNVGGTMNVLWAMKECAPEAHLIKLGTEGEYPDWLWDLKHIPEGNRIMVGYDGIDNGIDVENRTWEIPTPRYAGSFYHWSKVFDDFNIDYANRIWGLTATNVQQGVVVGHVEGTRLDIDQYFGTVANRFAAQAAIGMPLTVYGQGDQTRGFIPLKNSIDALRLLVDNPPERGEFRVIHQSSEALTVNEIAQMVSDETSADIQHIKSPRAESDRCEFTFDTSTLDSLGLERKPMREAIAEVCQVAEENRDNIIRESIIPTTNWK